MAVYWWRVCEYREANNIPFTLPLWSRMAGDFKNLPRTMTKPQLRRYIGIAVAYFDMIKFLLGRAGATMQLAESTPMNSLVRDTCMTIMSWPEDRLLVEWEKFQKFKAKQAA